MTRYSIFAFLVMAAAIFGQYKYSGLLNERIDSRNHTIAQQVVTIAELKQELENTQLMLMEQSRQLEDNISEFEAYKKRVQNIKNTVIKVPVYTEVIKTEPVEVIILKANEGTNAVIQGINIDAVTFTGVRN